MNLLESLFKAATPPETPLHVGEVMSLWTYLAAINESRMLCLCMVNHTSDPELRSLIEHLVQTVEIPQSQELEKFLRQEGVALPPASPDKPVADEAAIPTGAKFTDEEIANVVVVKLIGLLGTCATGMIEAIRDDVAAMFYRYQAELLAGGLTIRKTMQKRGWLKLPPYYYAGQPNTGSTNG